LHNQNRSGGLVISYDEFGDFAPFSGNAVYGAASLNLMNFVAFVEATSKRCVGVTKHNECAFAG